MITNSSGLVAVGPKHCLSGEHSQSARVDHAAGSRSSNGFGNWLSADTLAAIAKGLAMNDAYDRMIEASIAHDDLAYRKARDDFERAKAK